MIHLKFKERTQCRELLLAPGPPFMHLETWTDYYSSLSIDLDKNPYIYYRDLNITWRLNWAANHWRCQVQYHNTLRQSKSDVKCMTREFAMFWRFLVNLTYVSKLTLLSHFPYFYSMVPNYMNGSVWIYSISSEPWYHLAYCFWAKHKWYIFILVNQFTFALWQSFGTFCYLVLSLPPVK